MNNFFLLFIAFITGFSITAMEITSSRILAPYFGSSIFIWTNIIGVVMLSLSIGYWWGGRLADKKPDLNFLLKIILFSGFFFLIIPFFVKPLSLFVISKILIVNSSSFVLFIGSFLIMILLFGVPFIFLGMVSPFIIKIYPHSENNIGRVAGNIFMTSTIGCLIGTFLPAIFLIPYLGTQKTIYIFSFILILLGVLGVKKKYTRYFFLLLVIVFIVFLNLSNSISAKSNNIFETESVYQYIKLTKKDEGLYLLKYEGGFGVESILDENNILTGEFYDYASLLPLMTEKKKDKYLIIGLGGGTIANTLKKIYHNNISVAGVEIDNKVIDIAEKFLKINNSEVEIINMDGRMFLKFNDKKFDNIYIDVYRNEFYIPPTFTTVEFWKLVKKSLNKEGVVAMNIGVIDENSEVLRFISNSIASEFKYTYKMGPVKKNSGNFMILASDSKIDFDKMKERSENNILDFNIDYFLKKYKKIEYDENLKILTDDWSPIEFLTDRMFYKFIKHRLKN